TGLTNLESLDELIEANRANYRAYAKHLAGLPGVRLFPYDERHRSNYQYLVTLVGEDAPLTRDEIVAVLHAENVMARRYFHPGVHRMEPYRTRFPDAHRLLPETERVASRIIVLPTGTAVEPADIARICEVFRSALHHAPELRR